MTVGTTLGGSASTLGSSAATGGSSNGGCAISVVFLKVATTCFVLCDSCVGENVSYVTEAFRLENTFLQEHPVTLIYQNRPITQKRVGKNI